MKAYYLLLDDIRNANQVFEYTHQIFFLTQSWTIAKTYQEFVTFIIDNGLPEFISFDHDLGEESIINGEEKSGYDCTKWLIDYCITNKLNLPAYFCHSMNPVGKANICGLLNSYAMFCLDDN